METLMAMDKKAVRKRLLEKLLFLTKEEIKRRSENVEKILSNLPIYKNAKVIMGYYPLKGEVDVLEMLRKVLGIKRLCFPVMDLEKNNLRAFAVENISGDFVSGPKGVMQPDIGKTKEVDVKDIDLILVPGLAFDSDRNRLGRGAGFYDRFLKKVSPPTKKVGVAFEFQIIDNLPVNSPFDEKLDIIVSEKGVV